MVAIFRLELAEERAQNLTGQKTANECMDILKVFMNIRNTRHHVSYHIMKALVEKPQFFLFFTVYAFVFQEYIAQRSPDFRKTFVKFDSDGDGKISRKEFRMVGMIRFKEDDKPLWEMFVYLSIYLFLTSAGIGQSGSIHE